MGEKLQMKTNTFHYQNVIIYCFFIEIFVGTVLEILLARTLNPAGFAVIRWFGRSAIMSSACRNTKEIDSIRQNPAEKCLQLSRKTF
jgi:hypothetical protein